jgi:hypothetical protein
MDQVILAKREQQVLYDKKWKKFLHRIWLFRCLPFVDFVLGAGSLAIGHVSPDSDFDVIVGAKSGRIFTARFFAATAFGLFGWRRSRLTHREFASNKICLNHFVTPTSYALKPPYTDSWRELYRNLVPVWGDHQKIEEFFAANVHWMHEKGISSTSSGNIARAESRGYNIIFENDLRFNPKRSSLLKKSLEYFLSGKIGNLFECFVKFIQIKKIERSLKNDEIGYKPRIVYNDQELEFHPDRRKFENG